MRSVHEHRSALLDLITAPLSISEVPILDAVGQALAADLVANEPLPRFDNSAMDGYAVRVADLVTVPVTMPVIDELPAGTAAHKALRPDSVARIMTGAPLPVGADAVVQVEFTDGGAKNVRIDRAVPAGTAIRRAGEDVDAGSAVMRTGDAITPGVLGLLASLGIAEAAAHRRPRVSICITGDDPAHMHSRLSGHHGCPSSRR